MKLTNEQKYIYYKKKYSSLKKQSGGGSTLDEIIIDLGGIRTESEEYKIGQKQVDEVKKYEKVIRDFYDYFSGKRPKSDPEFIEILKLFKFTEVQIRNILLEDVKFIAKGSNGCAYLTLDNRRVLKIFNSKIKRDTEHRRHTILYRAVQHATGFDNPPFLVRALQETDESFIPPIEELLKCFAPSEIKTKYFGIVYEYAGIDLYEIFFGRNEIKIMTYDCSLWINKFMELLTNWHLANRSGLYHLDIKLENITLLPINNPIDVFTLKLIDFGNSEFDIFAKQMLDKIANHPSLIDPLAYFSYDNIVLSYVYKHCLTSRFQEFGKVCSDNGIDIVTYKVNAENINEIIDYLKIFLNTEEIIGRCMTIFNKKAKIINKDCDRLTVEIKIVLVEIIQIFMKNVNDRVTAVDVALAVGKDIMRQINNDLYGLMLSMGLILIRHEHRGYYREIMLYIKEYIITRYTERPSYDTVIEKMNKILHPSEEMSKILHPSEE
jgi:serine/threonine protein kinase